MKDKKIFGVLRVLRSTLLVDRYSMRICFCQKSSVTLVFSRCIALHSISPFHSIPDQTILSGAVLTHPAGLSFPSNQSNLQERGGQCGQYDNMKRSLQQHQQEPCNSNEQHHPQQQQQQDDIFNTNSPQYYDLGSCLKRVRISMSPGELRLDRDLSELGDHWMQIDERVHVCEYARLERTNDPLRLVLRIQHVELQIAVNRLYPHAPPVVTKSQDLSSTRIQRVSVSLASQYQYTFAEEDEMEDEQTTVTANTTAATTATISADRDGGTLVYDHWSPIQQMGHLVDFLVDAFRQYHHDSSNSSSSSNATIVSEDHEDDDDDAMQIASPIKTKLPLDSLLKPNRFDVGYDRQRRSTLMEC
jgi:hypothetical protein